MKDFDNISQALRITSILYWFTQGEKFTMRELAKRLIEQFHPKKSNSLFNDKVYNNLSKSLREDFIKIEDSGLIKIEKKKLKMMDASDEFGPKYRKNQNEYWIDREIDLPIQFSFGRNQLLTALILKKNLTIFKGTEFQEKINELIDSIDNYVEKENGEIHAEIFENLNTGEHDLAALTDDISEIIRGITHKYICTGMYRGVRDETYKKIEFIPIKFLLFKNTLYLHSFKPEDHGYRNYNVSRFKPKTLLSSDRKIHFKLPENKWASLRENSFGIVYVGKVKKVKLEFLPKAVKHVKDRKWHFKPNILLKKNGNMVMEMDLYITTELISEIMRWMPNVIVHKPSELINKVKKRLMDSLTNNKWNIA